MGRGSCDGGDLTKGGDSGNVSRLVAGNDVMLVLSLGRQTGGAPGP